MKVQISAFIALLSHTRSFGAAISPLEGIDVVRGGDPQHSMKSAVFYRGRCCFPVEGS